MAKPVRIVRIRRDWPPGSNARLLETQLRHPGGWGFTCGAPGPQGAVAPALRGAPRRRVPEVPAEPAPDPARLLTQGPRAVWGMLRELAEADAILPSNLAISRSLGLSLFHVDQAFEVLAAGGLIAVEILRQHGTRALREIRLVGHSRVLRSRAPAGWPA